MGEVDGKIISAEQQKDIQNTLEKSIDRYSAKGGAVIVMDADNSQVLSMTSAYEGNGIFNYIYDFKYKPAATYMPFIVALGLENKVISDDTKFDISKPLITSKNLTIRDIKPTKYEISTGDILALSSNIAISQISINIDFLKHIEFIYAVELAKHLSLRPIDDVKKDITLLSKDLVKDLSACIGMGYCLDINPLQLTAAYASLINGGIYHAPTLETNSKNEGKYIISKENSQKMQKYLRKSVTNGTAKQANIDNIEFMAKTGTVFKDIDGILSEKNIITSVIGNFKYGNTHYVIYVMLDEPQAIEETFGFRTSGWNAVPTAKEIINIIIGEK